MNGNSVLRSGLITPSGGLAALSFVALLATTCSDGGSANTTSAEAGRQSDGGSPAPGGTAVGKTGSEGGARSESARPDSSVESSLGLGGDIGGGSHPSSDATATRDSGVTGSGGAGRRSTGAGGVGRNGGATGAGGAPGSVGAGGKGHPDRAGGSANTPGSSGGSVGSGLEGGTTSDGGSGVGPCDIYASAETPCVAAHSTVRSLYGSYSGNLYQIKRSSDNTTKDIGVLSPGGFASAATQDAFCSGTTCVITIVYDQSGHENHLEYQGQGSSCGGKDKAASATTESLSVHGNKVYSLYINPGNSYWRDGHTTGVPTDSSPEGMYMVTSGTHVNSGCCFDYGNSETDRKADGAGAMDAIYFGTSCWFGGCSGAGPWVQADLEYGLYPGGSSSWNSKQVAFTSRYVTAMLKNNGTSKFALKGGNAQSGNLTTLWDGSLPSGYNPMKKQGAIVLGSGGDCCATNTNQSAGTFYEGAIVSGYPSDAADNAVQTNVVTAGYGATQ